MVRLVKDETLTASWQDFFEDKFKAEIETLATEYPDKRSLLIDYWDVDKADPKLAELLIHQPFKTLFNAEEALKLIDVSMEQKLQLHFRVKNIPESQKILIRKIRANRLARAKHHAAVRKGNRAMCLGLTGMSPTSNILRDPRWGRSDPTRSFRRGSPYKGDRHGGLLMLPTRTSNKYNCDILNGDARLVL